MSLHQAASTSLNQVLRLVAMLGGFLARKGDGEPGVKTIWIGLQRVMDCVVGLQFKREALRGELCVMGWALPGDGYSVDQSK